MSKAKQPSGSMQRLPNLGRLDLRQRAKTGADGGNGGAPNPKRQRTSKLSDEDRDRQVETFVRSEIVRYFGQMPSDPQVVADFRQRVVQVVQEMHRSDGLTENWPTQLGITEGVNLLEGNKKETNINILKLRQKLWSQGIIQLVLERDRDARDSDLQKKARMVQNELREKDASDGAAFFNDREPAQPPLLGNDMLLLSDLIKKASDGDQRKWGEASRMQGEDRGRCCKKNS